MRDDSQYFKYMEQPRKKRTFKKILAGFVIIVVAIVFGFLLYLALLKIEGKEMPFGKKNDPKPVATMNPTASPTPTRTPVPTLVPTEKPTDPSQMKTGLSRETLAVLQNDPRTPVKVKGIYVTGAMAGSEGMDDLIRLVEETELNAMVIDIKNDSGEITYKMDLDIAKEIGATVGYVRDMEGMVKKLKEKDVYLIARVVAFKDPILAEKKPEYCLRKKDGTIFRDKDGLAWVNPYKKEIWEYLIAVSKKAIELGFDEVQFDYIRFSTDSGMKSVTFGQEAKGVTRQEVINGFTAYAYEQLMPLGAFVSADVYGSIITNDLDVGTLGQDYGEMASCLDYICPMIYPSHYSDGVYNIDYPDTQPYELILNALGDSVALLKESKGQHQAVVRPWLQDFTATWLANHITYDKEQIQDQIRAVKDAGYEEWILWNSKNRYTESAFKKE